MIVECLPLGIPRKMCSWKLKKYSLSFIPVVLKLNFFSLQIFLSKDFFMVSYHFSFFLGSHMCSNQLYLSIKQTLLGQTWTVELMTTVISVLSWQGFGRALHSLKLNNNSNNNTNYYNYCYYYYDNNNNDNNSNDNNNYLDRGSSRHITWFSGRFSLTKIK